MNAARNHIHFTVEEANRRLPLVRLIVTDIVALARDLEDRRDRLQSIRDRTGAASKRRRENVYSEELEEVELAIERDKERLRDFIAELEELDVELRDPLQGRVDFPTAFDGIEAYLCWQAGEEEVTHWRWQAEHDGALHDLLEQTRMGDPPEPGDALGGDDAREGL